MRHSSSRPRPRDAARSSLAGALAAADQLPGAAAETFTTVARTAFVDGIHLAATFGVVLAVVAAILTRRFLPREVAPTGAMRSPIEALENAAEFGIGGALPVFADDPRGERRVGPTPPPCDTDPPGRSARKAERDGVATQRGRGVLRGARGDRPADRRRGGRRDRRTAGRPQG